MKQTDETSVLISKVALGDKDAFASLYKDKPETIRDLPSYIERQIELKEALQDVYIKIWKRSSTFGIGESVASAWLATIARNHSIDVIRARKPVTEDLLAEQIWLTTSIKPREGGVGKRRRTPKIDDCMRELDQVHAKAVRQAYVEGLSYLELAQELQVPLNTVRTWLRRSLLKLRECMQAMTSNEQSHGKRGQDDVLAGEYVLGVLSNEKRRQVELKGCFMTRFALLVERWQISFSRFNDIIKNCQ